VIGYIGLMRMPLSRTILSYLGRPAQEDGGVPQGNIVWKDKQ